MKRIKKDFFNKIKNSSSSYIIAEIGVNHNGDINLAKKLISQAKTLGADAVKFQSFSASALADTKTPKVNAINEARIECTIFIFFTLLIRTSINPCFFYRLF